ncbi:hypothetical protein BH23VER1_BH23VER1_24320 [soil metagenome]
MNAFITRLALGLLTAVLVALIYIYHGEVDDEGNPTNLGTLLALYLAVGLIVGGFVILVVLPALGERVGSLFYSDESQMEKDPRAAAIAALNRGDYDEAITEFRELAKLEPDDRGHVVEIARIYHEKLHNPDAAISIYEQALQSKEWPEDDEAFYLFRLSDLYSEEHQDFEKSRSLLETALERFPETRHSANATHKLHELEQAQYAAEHGHHHS